MEEKNIKVNNIEVSCKTLIEFSSLANILLELAKNQKEMEKKLNDQDIKINSIKKLISSGGGGGLNNWQEKENEMSNILKEDDLNMNFNEYNNINISNDLNNAMIKENQNEDNGEINNNIDDNQKTSKREEGGENGDGGEGSDEGDGGEDDSNKKNSDEKKTKKKENQIQNELKDNELENISSNIKPLSKKLEDVKIDLPIDNKNTSDLVSKTFKKVVLLEKKVSELITKAGEHSILIKNIQNNRKAILENAKSIKNLNELTKKLKDELGKTKEKLTDFNIFDMFKDSGDGNIDMAKGLVMALEKKLTKRLDLMDEKYKSITADNFKNKSELQNISNIVDNSSSLIKKNTKKIEEIISSNNDNYNKNKEEKEKNDNDLKIKIEDILKKFEDIEKNNNNKLSELEEKIKNELKNNTNITTNNEKVEKGKKKVDAELLNNIKEMSEKVIELEKNVKYILKKFNVDEIVSNLSVLQKELTKKGNQGAIDDINDRIYILDELIKEINSRCDSFSLIDQKNREENSLLTKKVESLSSQFHKLSLESHKTTKEEKTIIDLTKFIDLNTFDDNKKEINRKFDKIRISFEDILRNIEEILNKLSHTPTDKDFAQYQGVIKNMLDELKINSNKKYAEKYETIKNIKFLETQIKTINDQYVKKAEGQDNWLLAKKPMSNYLCASCESVIRGELDKRSEYIPWNKYPNREEKYTRMGHGFSHMLQLVNDDIRKNVDNKEKIREKEKSNEKEYNSDEDKKKTDSNRTLLVNTSINVKLPKVRQRPRNNNNLNIIDDAVFDKNGGSPYDNRDKNQSVLDSNKDGPYIVKISKLKKITNKKSFRETSVNEENSSRRNNINIKTFPSELSSFEKKQGDYE